MRTTIVPTTETAAGFGETGRQATLTGGQAAASGEADKNEADKGGSHSTPEHLRQIVIASLEDGKAQDLVEVDLRGKSAIGDYMFVASGTSQRHVGSMADRLAQQLKDAGAGPVAMEGVSQCDWVLIDAGDVIVHLFRPEVRQFYQLEKMWGRSLPAPKPVT